MTPRRLSALILLAALSIGTASAVALAVHRAGTPADCRGASVATVDDGCPPAELAAACRQTAEWVQRALPDGCEPIVHPPWVLSGDLPRAELKRWRRETVEPAARAMAAAYFGRLPRRPVVILLFRGEASYRRGAEKLFGDRHVSRFGYYRPTQRTVLINAGDGRAALLHELTHVLAGDDWPDMPEWLSEGLASLHEQSEVRADGAGMVGRVNWRQAVLRAAMREGTLPSLRSLLAGSDFHGVRQKLSYAHARCFCLYLQRRGLLAQCCRALHDRPSGSPETACEVISRLAGQPWSQIEDDFRTFAASLYGVVLPPTSQAAGRGRRPDR